MTDDEPQFNLRWWWDEPRTHPVTWSADSSVAENSRDDVIRMCQSGSEVWEQLEEGTSTGTGMFWVITPEIARTEQTIWGPYDYDQAVMIAITLH